MFPGHNARVDYNEAGEPIGWDYPTDDEPPYCDICGYIHPGPCPDEEGGDDE